MSAVCVTSTVPLSMSNGYEHSSLKYALGLSRWRSNISWLEQILQALPSCQHWFLARNMTAREEQTRPKLRFETHCTWFCVLHDYGALGSPSFLAWKNHGKPSKNLVLDWHGMSLRGWKWSGCQGQKEKEIYYSLKPSTHTSYWLFTPWYPTCTRNSKKQRLHKKVNKNLKA